MASDRHKERKGAAGELAAMACLTSTPEPIRRRIVAGMRRLPLAADIRDAIADIPEPSPGPPIGALGLYLWWLETAQACPQGADVARAALVLLGQPPMECEAAARALAALAAAGEA